MSFEAEMIVPSVAVDDLGQTAEATNTMLRYSLELGYFQNRNWPLSSGSMQILKEELSHIKKGEAGNYLLFKHSKKDWLDSGLRGRRLKAFNLAESRIRVSELIDDFVPLRELKAFQRLEEDILKLKQTVTAFSRPAASRQRSR